VLKRHLELSPWSFSIALPDNTSPSIARVIDCFSSCFSITEENIKDYPLIKPLKAL
jgi:hypothetical protein